jgi:hypothetical protein
MNRKPEEATDLGYEFTGKGKLPKGFSFPIKRSVLDEFLRREGITSATGVGFCGNSGSNVVLGADYYGPRGHHTKRAIQHAKLLKPAYRGIGTRGLPSQASPSLESNSPSSRLRRSTGEPTRRERTSLRAGGPSGHDSAASRRTVETTRKGQKGSPLAEPAACGDMVAWNVIVAAGPLSISVRRRKERNP